MHLINESFQTNAVVPSLSVSLVGWKASLPPNFIIHAKVKIFENHIFKVEAASPAFSQGEAALKKSALEKLFHPEA